MSLSFWHYLHFRPSSHVPGGPRPPDPAPHDARAAAHPAHPAAPAHVSGYPRTIPMRAPPGARRWRRHRGAPAPRPTAHRTEGPGEGRRMAPLGDAKMARRGRAVRGHGGPWHTEHGGAARKGEYRARHFGGVAVFAVVKRLRAHRQERRQGGVTRTRGARGARAHRLINGSSS